MPAGNTTVQWKGRLGRSYNSFTPAEKEIVDRWMDKAGIAGRDAGSNPTGYLSQVSHPGGKAPNFAFIDQWFSGKGKRKARCRQACLYPQTIA